MLLDIRLPKVSSPIVYTLGIFTGTAILLSIYRSITTKRYRIRKSLKGKVILITGGTSGIGKECVKELAKQFATIHILARDLRKAELVANEVKKLTGNENIFVHLVNLSDFTTVRIFAKKFLATGARIDVLINNAALMNMEKRLTVDGLEETLQANYLSHFLLTDILLERIVQSGLSRIVNVTSMAYQWAGDLDMRDASWTKKRYNWMVAYARTKLEMILWTRELARRTYGKGVSVNCVHPGAVRTSILRDIPVLSMWTFLSILTAPLAIGASLGAQTILYLATEDKLEHVSGHYFVNCQSEGLRLRALDDQLAREVWWESEQLTARKK